MGLFRRRLKTIPKFDENGRFAGSVRQLPPPDVGARRAAALDGSPLPVLVWPPPGMEIPELPPEMADVGPYGPNAATVQLLVASGLVVPIVEVDPEENWADDTPLSEVVFCVLDTETTGTDPTVDSIVEVGVVTMRGDGTVLDRWSTTVCPSNGWVTGTQIHGIDRETMAGSPTFDEVLRPLVARMSGKPILAHNTNFDVNMLWAEFERCGYQAGATVAVDTRDLAALHGFESQKLGDLAAVYGLVNEAAHRAWADAEVCGNLLSVMAPPLGVATVHDLCQVVEVNDGFPGDWPEPQVSDEVRARMRSARQDVLSGKVPDRPDAMRGVRWSKTSGDKWYVSAPADAGVEPGSVIGVKTKGTGKVAEVEVTKVWPDRDDPSRVLMGTKQIRAWTPPDLGDARWGEPTFAGRVAKMRQAYKFGETIDDMSASPVPGVDDGWDVVEYGKTTYRVMLDDLSCSCRGRVEGVCSHVSKAVFMAWPDDPRPPAREGGLIV